MLSPATFEIHRRIMPPLLGLSVCSVFIVVWIMEFLTGMRVEGIPFIVFSAFVILFVLPVASLMTYLAVTREPVVAVRGDSVHVTSPTLAWRKAILPSSDIVDIETDWIRDTSYAMIVFRVKPERFALQTRSGPWNRRKEDKLYLNVLNTDHTPAEAAVALCVALRMCGAD